MEKMGGPKSGMTSNEIESGRAWIGQRQMHARRDLSGREGYRVEVSGKTQKRMHREGTGARKRAREKAEGESGG